VDSCLGGFVIAFSEKLDQPIEFDYRIPGVTSISCDNHKYGLAPKGVSTITFKNRKLRRYCYYAIHTWPGGLYATTTLKGSWSAAPIVGAWIQQL